MDLVTPLRLICRAASKRVLLGALPLLYAALALCLQGFFHDLMADKPFLLVYPAIFLGSFHRGIFSRLAASTCAILGVWYLFVQPYYSFSIGRLSDAFGLMVFVLTCLTANLLASRLAAEHQRLRRTAQLRADFLAIAAHELRTPCHTMKLQAALCQRQSQRVDPEASLALLVQFVAQSTQQIDHLMMLLNDLLDVARIDAEKMSLATQPLELNELTRRIADKMRATLEAAGSSLTVRLSEPLHGLWDPARLEQVLTNLLSNAAKYGCGSPVEVRLLKITGMARLSVHDQGRGIRLADQRRIFGRFERASRHAESNSLGLGLYLVGQIVQAHRGRVEVSSRLGVGTTFTVDLPLTSGR